LNYPLIGIGVLALVAIVVAFFAARTWHWGQVIVVLGIVLSTIGFFLLSAEVLRVNAVLRTKVNQLEREVQVVDADNDALKNGSKDPTIIGRLRNGPWPNEATSPIGEESESIPSLAELDHQLLLATRDRGRMWRKVAPAGFDPQKNELKIGVESPVPSGITRDTIVYLFEEGEPVLPEEGAAPTGPQYLGEFRVTSEAPQGATLQPVLPLDDFELKRLTASRVPWVMYEVMPIDRYEIFEKMSEDELKKQLPPQSVNEYLRHGKEANADDSDLRKMGVDENNKPLPNDKADNPVKTVYQRRLRDYALEFDQLAKQRAVLVTDLEGVNLDIKKLEAALAVGKQVQAFREDEVKKLNTDLAGVKKEHAAIAAHLKLIEQQLARVEALLAEILRRNHAMARELAARQSRNGEPVEVGPSTAAAARGSLAQEVAR
jgi:hypothetical protein